MKSYISFLTIAAMVGLLVGQTARADDTITVTVQIATVSVAVTDGTINYGTLGTSEKQDTTPTGLGDASGLNDLQTATVSGTVNANLTIEGQDATHGAGVDWTLAATVGNNQYVHKFCNDTDNDCTTNDTNYAALTTTPTSLKENVAPSGTVGIHFEIQAPSGSTDTDVKNADVTVMVTPA